MKAPGLTLELHCPHCGKDSRVTIGTAHARTVTLIEPPPARPLTSKSRVCGCGHGAEFHGPDGRGPCTYGHGTALGGCRGCPRYHRRGSLPKSNGARYVPARDVPGTDIALGRCEQAILTALVQRDRPTSRAAVALLSHYSPDSGSFSTALGKLRAAALIEGSADALVVTEPGKVAAGDVEELPSGEDLLAYWVERLGPCAGAILQVLATAYPAEVDRDRLAQATGYSASSGSFSTALGRLRTLELVEGFRASDTLMTASKQKKVGT